MCQMEGRALTSRLRTGAKKAKDSSSVALFCPASSLEFSRPRPGQKARVDPPLCFHCNMEDLRKRMAFPENRGSIRLGFFAAAIAVPSAYMLFHRCSFFVSDLGLCAILHFITFKHSLPASNPPHPLDVQAKKLEKELYFEELEAAVEVRQFCVPIRLVVVCPSFNLPTLLTPRISSIAERRS